MVDMEDTPLPLKSVVLFAAVGGLIVILVFLFLKRQITRFALKSYHNPHYPIGADAPKALRQEIERRLRRVADIKHEPQLVHSTTDQSPPLYFGGKVYHSFYRMKAIDLIKRLESELLEYDCNTRRDAGSCLKRFLLSQSAGALKGIPRQSIDTLCVLYEHARHEVTEFREAEFKQFEKLINEMLQHIRTKISKGENKKTFPFQVGDSVFYCPQNADVATADDAQTTRNRNRNNKATGFVKLKNKGSESSLLASYEMTTDDRDVTPML